MAGAARGVDGPCTTHGDNRVPKRWPGMGCGRASCVCPDPSQASDLERFNPVFIDPWDMNSPRESPWVALGSLLKAVGWREHSLQHRGVLELEVPGVGRVGNGLLLPRGSSMMLHKDVQWPFSRLC